MDGVVLGRMHVRDDHARQGGSGGDAAGVLEKLTTRTGRVCRFHGPIPEGKRVWEATERVRKGKRGQCKKEKWERGKRERAGNGIDMSFVTVHGGDRHPERSEGSLAKLRARRSFAALRMTGTVPGCERLHHSLLSFFFPFSPLFRFSSSYTDVYWPGTGGSRRYSTLRNRATPLGSCCCRAKYPWLMRRGPGIPAGSS